MEKKIKHAQGLIECAVTNHPRVAVACSFGKDSMVTVHIAKEVAPDIDIFAVMTVYKPRETYEYLKLLNAEWNLNTTVYMVADHIPEDLQDDELTIILLPPDEFIKKSNRIKAQTGQELYEVDPDECCRLLKVEPTKVAVRSLDAWICGLRNTEGRIREDYREIEDKGGLIKINPILTFTEAEIWRYIATRGIKSHPWYGLGYRSLGCKSCSQIGGLLERDGRWKNTSKCGGECGIHTQLLK